MSLSLLNNQTYERVPALNYNNYDNSQSFRDFEQLQVSAAGGKEERKCQIKFIDAHRKLMKHTEYFQVVIHTNIKNAANAERLCNFYQELANKERSADRLYCYVDYVSLEFPMDIKHYDVRMCHWGRKAQIRGDVLENIVRCTLVNGQDTIVLYQSYDKDFLLQLRGAIKDVLKVFTVRLNSRFFNHSPEKTFYVMYIDPKEKLQKSHDFH